VIRAALRAFLRALLRVFFRRIELAGTEHLPGHGAVLLVANHPSSLVDPVLLLAFAPRPVAFLAKEPIFRMPVVGSAARALDSIPVYRAMDGADPRRNLAMFAAARALLRRGGALALFPEGTSHDDPHLKPLKTGAARIALGAASAGEAFPLWIAPVGLVFTEKGTFRSDVLVSFGAPIEVEPVVLAPDGEPAPEDVRALTGRIEGGLAALVLQAESQGALSMAAAAERLLTIGDETPLADRVALRRRLLGGRAWLRARDPILLASLERRVQRHLELLDAAGLSGPEALERIRAAALGRAGLHLLLFPAALAGALVHLAPWHTVDALARRFARGDQSMAATLKLGFGLLAYPLTWAAVGVCGGLWRGPLAGGLCAAAAILSAAAVLAFEEGSEPIRALARATRIRLGRRSALDRLRRERDALRAELFAAAGRLPAPDGAGDRAPSAGG
jgi:glycerol-3-phosphate O-acyltransferase/dihydroxyacetone phosphate acyltransferase